MNPVILLFLLPAKKFVKLLGFRDSSNSLRLRSNIYINKNYHDLHNSKLKNIFHYILDRKRWWLIILGVGFNFFIIPLINIEILSIIKLDATAAKTIVDQRTANFAAIISMTLVVVGFLINSLALKEPNAYKVLFKYSYFYPVIYFTLSTIGCFIVLSTLRDSLNENYFVRSVLSGTYAALIILLLIGLLFNRIIIFTNTKEIKKIYNIELFSEAKEEIKKGLLATLSKKYYEEFMEQNGVSKFDWLEGLGSPVSWSNSTVSISQSNDKENDIITSKQKVVYDINLEKIRKYILKVNKKTQNSSLRYQERNIGSLSSKLEYCILSNGEDIIEKRKKRILSNSIILRKQQKYESEPFQARAYFDSKIEELIDENKHKEAETILDTYFKLYELKIKNQA